MIIHFKQLPRSFLGWSWSKKWCLKFNNHSTVNPTMIKVRKMESSISNYLPPNKPGYYFTIKDISKLIKIEIRLYAKVYFPHYYLFYYGCKHLGAKDSLLLCSLSLWVDIGLWEMLIRDERRREDMQQCFSYFSSPVTLP